MGNTYKHKTKNKRHKVNCIIIRKKRKAREDLANPRHRPRQIIIMRTVSSTNSLKAHLQFSDQRPKKMQPRTARHDAAKYTRSTQKFHLAAIYEQGQRRIERTTPPHDLWLL